MFAAGIKIASRTLPAITKQTVRHNNVIVTPPRERCSFIEKCAHGTIMFFSIMAIPTWVSVNLKHWRPQKEGGDENYYMMDKAF